MFYGYILFDSLFECHFPPTLCSTPAKTIFYHILIYQNILKYEKLNNNPRCVMINYYAISIINV